MKVLAIVPLIEICLGTAFNAAAISRGKEDYVDAIMMGLSSFVRKAAHISVVGT